MNHEEQLLLYAAGRLGDTERAAFETHLAGCPECRAGLRLWQPVAEEIAAADGAVAAPAGLAESALGEIRRRPAPQPALFRAAGLLRAQALLVQRELWPASAAVMALGVIVVWVSGHSEFLYFLAPLLSAASLGGLFGPAQDPAHELALSTPTSAWKILLARLSLVSAYNAALALAALLLLLPLVPPGPLGALALGLLAPMAFLSASALLLSLWIGTGNAVVAAYALWLLQYANFQTLNGWTVPPEWGTLIAAWRNLWHNPALLLILTVPIVLIALKSADRPALHRAI
jgi:hypothetical protein